MQLQHGLIFLRLVHTEIIKQFAALSDFAKETASCGMIFLVILQMAGQKDDFLCEDRDLYLRGAGVFLMNLTVGDKFLLCAALDCHGEIGVTSKIREFAGPPGRFRHPKRGQ